MSVVNDVLKNLEKRQVKKNMKSKNPLMVQPNPRDAYLFWGMVSLSLSIVISVSVFAYVWVNSSQLQQSTVLPYDLLLAPESAFSSDATQKYAKAKPLTPVNVPAVNNPTEKRSSEKSATVTKTQTTKASENAIQAINNGNAEQAKRSLAKSTPSVQDQVNLRLMLKDNPENVLGYIQKNYQYQDKPELIAMAAQGQQRSGKHKSAVILYRKLISMQPNNAKWRAGIAISYEVMGMKSKAKTAYQLALNMANLPSALRRFSEGRLKQLMN